MPLALLQRSTFFTKVSCDVVSGTQISNRATVTSSTPDPSPANNSATANVATVSASLTVTPVVQSFNATGGFGSVNVTSSGNCGWTVKSNDNFLLLADSGSGIGNGIVRYYVYPNINGGARTGTITIAGQTHTVSQAAGPNVIITDDFNGDGKPDLAVANSGGGRVAAPGTTAIISVLLNTCATAGNLASTSAAGFRLGRVAPESIVAAFGTNLASETQSAAVIPLPPTLAGTSVKVKDYFGDERLAPLFFVSPAQINFLVPPGTEVGTATITVIRNNNPVATGTSQISLTAAGLFSANSNGQGVPAASVLRIKADGSQSYEPVAQFDAAQQRFVPRPVDLGPESDQVFLILFGSGVRGRSSLARVTAQIGGANTEVTYAGQQDDFVGLDQMNLRLSRTLIGCNEVDDIVTVDGRTANILRVSFK